MDDTLQVQIIYSGVEYMMTFQPNQKSFNDLLTGIKTIIRVNKPIQLMTVNTQESYQILSKSNYNSIMKEEFENNKLILFANEEDEYKDSFEPVNNIEENEDSDSNSNDDDDGGEMKDDSFSKEVEDERIGNKKKNRKSNLSKENDNSNPHEKRETNTNTNSNQDDDNFTLFSSKEDDKISKAMISNHVSKVIKDIPISSSIIAQDDAKEKERDNDNDKSKDKSNCNKSNNNSKNDENGIKPNQVLQSEGKSNKEYEQLNINEEKKGLSLNQPQAKESMLKISQDKPKDLFNNKKPLIKKDIIHPSPKLESFSKETCSICKGALQYFKFICCICDNNIIMCTECEVNHPHPSFKCKTHFLSTFQDLYSFIEGKHEIRVPLGISDLFKKDFEVEIKLKEGEITMRPNQTLNIPITIVNKSSSDIKIDQITLLIRNQGKLNLTYDDSSLIMKRNATVVLVLKCKSEYAIETSVIQLELYSNILKLKDSPGRTAVLRIEVNEDVEEEKLNAIFKGNDSLIMLNKKNKEMINYVIQQKMSIKSPEEIAQILMKNNWILEKAMDQLS